MDYAVLLSKIDELNEKYVQVWEELCALESPTTNKAAVDAAGAYIVRWAEALGFDTEVRAESGSGDPICVTMNPTATAAPVVMSGHIDTVHPIGLFGTPPCRRDDTYLYAPGAVDCKGGVVSSMLAMEALKACGFTARPVKLVVQTDEETSSKGSDKRTIAFMLEKAQGAVAFFNAEGCVANKVVLSRKGIARFKLRIHGKAVHSCRCYQGASAIAEAAHKLLRLEQYKDPDGITCNCGVIEGGTVANTVAAECSVITDFRFATQAQYEEIQAVLQELAAHSTVEGCTCEVETVSFRPSMEVADRNIALYNRINAIYTACGVTPVVQSHSNGGSDAAYTTLAGIPTVDNLGVDGSEIHSVHERGLLDSLALSAKRLAAATVGL